MTQLLSIPGRLARTAFAEREDRSVSTVDQWALALASRVGDCFLGSAAREIRQLARQAERLATELSALGDAELVARLRRVAVQAMHGLQREPVHEALLLVAEAAHRALGMRPYATQLVGAATLMRGRLAEMQTGEGKTLTAALGASLAACAGVPVHVVTVNDYLAERDAAKNQPLFAYLGLTVGVVCHSVPPHQRRPAYASDITYCTNKELVFDYLRDRVDAGGRATAAQLSARRLYGGATPPPLLRGLHFAIVDEADSVLIDEARTPLILAVKAGEVDHAGSFSQALDVASRLQPETDFVIEGAHRSLWLTAAGREQARALADSAGLSQIAGDAREHLVVQALRAHHLFLRDHHYLIDADGKVQIIDEYTGRVLPGRTWEQGLHQMIEAKEGLTLSDQTQTLARITYQRFFCRYLRLSGMTGTAREVARELSNVYRLPTVTIPTHRPSARRHLPPQVWPSEADKWQAVAAHVQQARQRGQPVLIGTRSVAASERLSAALDAHGLRHAVLNARQDAQEAAIVAAAGERGTITVATNMAGRGTDIALGDGVRDVGGLCVVLTEYHESKRSDRQLVGRCARQGDPGLAVTILAADDELFRLHGRAEAALLRGLAAARSPWTRWWLQVVRRAAQRRAERIHARTRRDTLRQDRTLDNLMSFTGDPV